MFRILGNTDKWKYTRETFDKDFAISRLKRSTFFLVSSIKANTKSQDKDLFIPKIYMESRERAL